MVLKVLPVCEDSTLRGGFTKVSEATRHLTAARLVSTLDDLGGSGFCTSTFEKMNRVYIVQGSPPIYLERGWYRYLWRCGHCDIMYPYSRLSSEQLWFVMECELCGIPIHRVLLPCAQARLSVFAQVALALAVGEKRLQLEHRDLNCGNILIQTAGKWEDCCSQVPPTSCLEGRVYQPCRGPTAKIVDFTFARLHHGASSFLSSLLHFLMQCRRSVVFGPPMDRGLKGKWSLYRPRTNVFWLEFLARVYLVQHLRDSRVWRGIKVKACPIHCGSYDDGVSTRTLGERQEEILALLKKSGSAMDFVALAQKRAPYLFQIERPQEKRSSSSDKT
ncbi:unnamed protein product [Hydatigera taeniaeformis]|uniref:Non-specific serine/threonine protein kinase n=1 Tax=Hydatigena taeniaeformis TaxID=6205 RepID=A0A3P7FJE8_HYDTA|nr:unnamed protein product [Hydatigera taeniaeformis]